MTEPLNGNTPGAPSGIVCPKCASYSEQPRDVQEGYCGTCHDWTGRTVDRVDFNTWSKGVMVGMRQERERLDQYKQALDVWSEIQDDNRTRTRALYTQANWLWFLCLGVMAYYTILVTLHVWDGPWWSPIPLVAGFTVFVIATVRQARRVNRTRAALDKT